MKRPVEKAKEVMNDSSRLETYTDYTPEALRVIADQMEEDGILHVKMGMWPLDSHRLNVKETRMESPEEAERRYARELEAYNKFKEKEKVDKANRKAQLIAEAKKLGLKISE